MIETGGSTMVDEGAQMRWPGARQRPEAGTRSNPAAAPETASYGEVSTDTVPALTGALTRLSASAADKENAIPHGLGVSEPSMTPRDIPAVKARMRGARLTDLQALAARALEAETPAGVRALDEGES